MGRRSPRALEAPVELRFVDLLLIIIATLMFIAIVLSITSAFAGSDQIDVATDEEPRVMSAVLPAAVEGQHYELMLAAAGGDGSYMWAIANGRLPDGLFLSPDGTVSGVPPRQDRTQVTIEVMDGQQRSHRRELVFEVRRYGTQPEQKKISLRVNSEIIWLPDAMGGRSYSYRFTADSGVPPYRWTLSGGRLPKGLVLTPEGDVIGVPKHGQINTFRVTATDNAGASVAQDVRLRVMNAPPALWRRVFSWFWSLITLCGYLLILWLAWEFIRGEKGGVVEVRSRPSLKERIKGRVKEVKEH